MSQSLSIKNPFYNYKIIDNSSDFLKDKNNENDLVVSYYVCSGELTFKHKNKIESKHANDKLSNTKSTQTENANAS